jgi:hypothetical protein
VADDGRKAVELAYSSGCRVALDRAIAKRPEWGAAWRQRGFAAAKPADAIADFSKAIALDGNDGDAYAARGRAWMHRKCRRRRSAISTGAGDRGGRRHRPGDVAWRAERAAAPTTGRLLRRSTTSGAWPRRGTPDDHRNLASALASDGDWHGARGIRSRRSSSAVQWFGERALVQIEPQRQGGRRRPRTMRAGGSVVRAEFRRSPDNARPRVNRRRAL